MTHIQDHRRSCHATLSDATVNALIAGAAEPFSFVISNRLSRESLPCFCRSRVPSEGEVEGNLLSRSFHSLSRLSRSGKGFVSGYAFRRTVKMYHTDPAPIGRHSESQRPATFTHHGTHQLRDVILALSRAKGKDLCIRAQRSQWQRTRLGIRLQPCRKPGNPTIASTHPSHLSLPPDVILSADSVLPRKTESSEGSMHSRSTEPVVEDSYQGTPSGVP